jgi:uncharacterized protein YbjT (DUF2867 family)
VNLTIVAATGGIGRHLLTLALAAGHAVTAVVRNPAALPADVHAVRVDLTAPDPVALVGAVAGADAVLSAAGARARSESGVAERGTRAIVAAMKETGARRLVVVSAAPIGTVPSPDRPHPPRHDPGEGFVMRTLLTPVVKRVFRANYADLARMEDVVRNSGLDWTVVRPPKLTDKPLTASYRAAYGRNLRGGTSVPRADVAHYMLRALTEPESVGKTVGIAT